MDKEKKLSFSFASKSRPPRPPSRPSAAAAAEEDDAAPRPAAAPRFVTEFDPSQTLAATAAPAVIPPLPNSGNFLNHRPRKPSSLPTPEEEAALAAETSGGPSFVLDTSNAPDDPSSHISYGLTVRNGSDATGAKESEKAAAAPPPPPATAGDLMLQRYKEDMASLPDHRGIDEFREVPVEGFGAALLAGYGWSEGKGIGRNNKTGDTKVVEYDRRAGTQGLGYNPSEADPKKTRSGDWIVGGGKKAAENGAAKKRDRDTGDKAEERDSSARKKRSGEKRPEREAREKESNGWDSREGKSSSSSNNVRWLQSHIRVRVVSEKLSRRLYLKKGKVVDVVGPTTCDIMMDDGSELVQGVEQDMLETVLPRTNGRVLVLYGKHKGVYGHLIQKSSEEEIGVVEDADTKDIIRVRYDQIAEYVGDPELLGYTSEQQDRCVESDIEELQKELKSKCKIQKWK